jgi:hypothetical protein
MFTFLKAVINVKTSANSAPAPDTPSKNKSKEYDNGSSPMAYPIRAKNGNNKIHLDDISNDKDQNNLLDGEEADQAMRYLSEKLDTRAKGLRKRTFDLESAEESKEQQILAKKKTIEHKVDLKKQKMIKPIINGSSGILSYDKFTQLINCVPDMFRGHEWTQVYSNIKDGTSFPQLMRQCRNREPFLLLVKDNYGSCFGFYGNEALKESRTNFSYYGSGETFLFTFMSGSNDIKPYYWTKKNDFFILVTSNGIEFGAGENYGLWIDEELVRGRTYRSDTFDNERLTLEEDFEIIKLEVWSIKAPQLR